MTSYQALKNTVSHRPLRGLILVTAITLLAFNASGADAPATSQGTTSPPKASQPSNPQLTAHDPQRDEKADVDSVLRIGNLDIDVSIAGNVARTTVTVRFDNPSARPLEGDFRLALPAGSTITGYALDINGVMVDGVLASQRQAAKAYETRLRQRVDPGLAEVTRDNAFHTRVFPILPGQGRTVRLTFVTPIDTANPFVLPLIQGAPVGQGAIHVKSDDPAAIREIKAPAGLKLTSAVGGNEAIARDVTLDGALRISVNTPASPITVARHPSGDTFFEIDDAAPAAGAAPVDAERVRIYWDRSLSRHDDDLTGELDLIARYLATAHAMTIDVVLFADGEPELHSYTSAADAVAALKAVDYRGATSLEKLAALHPAPADACLMFSDGNITLDPYGVRRMGCPLFTISSAGDANHAFLTALAQRSGGDHLDLKAASVDRLLARLTTPAPRVLDVIGADGEDVDYALLPAADGRIRLVGKMPSSGAVKVTLAGAAGPPRAYDLKAATPVKHEGLGALWAADRLGALSAGDQPDMERLLNFARRYSVASPLAAFVVLETPEDYAQAGIAPPDGLGKAAYARYSQLAAAKKREAQQAQDSRIDVVLSLWNDEKSWWNTTFPLKGAHRGGPAQSRGGEASPRPAPPPPPMAMAQPAPAAPAQRRGRASNVDMATQDSVSEVVVTGSRARSTDFAAAAPITVIGGDEFKASAGMSPAADRPEAGGAIKVEAAPWNPDRPYLKALDAASPDTVWTVFHAQEAQYGAQPAFYFDTAEWFARKGRKADAVSVALNVLELPTADTATLTILADRLSRYGQETRAIWLYERIAYLDPDRPQPLRNLALALIARADRLGPKGPSSARRADYNRALDLLNQVVTKPWDNRYDGIEVVSLMEANRIIPILKGLGETKIPLDPRFITLMDVDLRVTLEWNTDDTDMDLWVDEPDGERAIYSNPNTAIGGELSNDMTQGYGPEQYLLRVAPGGDYTVRANVYAADQLNPNGATVIRARLFRDWGRPTQTEEVLEIELKKDDTGAQMVGTFTVHKRPVRQR